MLDDRTDLSTDLDWMLQNDQADLDHLLDGLLRQHFQSLYRLALSLLDDQDAAIYVIAEALTTALVEKHKYRRDLGPRLWLTSLALDGIQKEHRKLKRQRFWRAVLPGRSDPSDFGVSEPSSLDQAALWLALDSVELPLRTLLLLHSLHAWTMVEIGKLMEQDDKWVLERLRLARRKLLESLQDQPFGAEDVLRQAQEGQGLDEVIAKLTGERWPALEFSEAQLESFHLEIKNQVQRRKTRRK